MFLAIRNFVRSTPLIKPIRLVRDYILTVLQPPYTYNQDGLSTTHNSDFMNDRLFVESYNLGAATYRGSGSFIEGSIIHWRIYVLCWAAYHASHLEGDFVECGVNRGWFSRAVIHYVDFNRLNKKFYLLDTFEGFSEKYILEEEKKLGRLTETDNYQYEDCYESVRKTFNEFPNVEIIRGPIPETLSQVDTNMVSYLSIDMNCVMPEIAAAEFFWDKLVGGAPIILDDYGWSGHHLQKQAFDEFASKKGVKVLSLPTGQGLIIKPS